MIKRMFMYFFLENGPDVLHFMVFTAKYGIAYSDADQDCNIFQRRGVGGWGGSMEKHWKFVYSSYIRI